MSKDNIRFLKNRCFLDTLLFEQISMESILYSAQKLVKKIYVQLKIGDDEF